VESQILLPSILSSLLQNASFIISVAKIQKHKNIAKIAPIVIYHSLRMTSIDSPTTINSKVNGCQSIEI
jgi:hypothetical protein